MRYYFGLPVTSGEVAWRVTREPVYPRWWWWFRPPPQAGAQTVAAGDTDLDADGRFRVTFTPEADEREADQPGVTYRYRLTADVTDEGGETRSADARLPPGLRRGRGRASTAEAGFFRRGEPAEPHRPPHAISTASPAPATAPGGWSRSQQPERALLPAEHAAADRARRARTEASPSRPPATGCGRAGQPGYSTAGR